MSFSATLHEKLVDANGVLYKVLALKISQTSGKFRHESRKLTVAVIDGTTEVLAIANKLTGDQKHIEAIFTTDAFIGFGSSVTIQFGLGDALGNEITGFDPGNFTPLSSISAAMTYVTADNAWLNSL